YEMRKNILKYDDVVSHQRRVIFGLRTEIIAATKVTDKIEKFRKELNQDLVDNYIPKNSYFEKWEVGALESEITRIYGLKIDLKAKSVEENVDEAEILNLINSQSAEIFAAKRKNY